MNPMSPTYVSKVLAAASSNGVGSFTAAGVVTLNTSRFDTARRIIINGSSALPTSVTLAGITETGTPIGETIILSTAVPAVSVQSVQDYLALTSVSVSSAFSSSSAGLIGTSSQGGTSWKVVDIEPDVTQLGFVLNPTTSAIQASFEYTMDYPAFNPNNRTWQNPNSLTGPLPFVSSMGSSVTANTAGFVGNPCMAWRITLSSSSSAAGTINASVLQTG